MAPVYANADDLAFYLLDSAEVSVGDPDAVERLLLRAERRVDAACGPWPLGEDGRKFAPDDLTEPQQAALARATCASAEHELLVGQELLAGEDDYVPSEVTILRRASRVSPRMLEELSGSGLIKTTLTVSPSPPAEEVTPVA